MWYMNEERELLVKTFREFAQSRVRPFVEKMETEEAGGDGLIKEMGELGFLSFLVDEKYGGSGPDYVNWGLLIEELAKENYTVAFLTMLQGYFSRAFINMGREDLIRKYVIPVMEGKQILAVAANEAVGSMEYTMKATRDGEGWRLSGTKDFITLQCVFRRTVNWKLLKTTRTAL